MPATRPPRSEEHTSELQSPTNVVCRLLLEKKKKRRQPNEDLPCLRLGGAAHGACSAHPGAWRGYALQSISSARRRRLSFFLIPGGAAKLPSFPPRPVSRR